MICGKFFRAITAFGKINHTVHCAEPHWLLTDQFLVQMWHNNLFEKLPSNLFCFKAIKEQLTSLICVHMYIYYPHSYMHAIQQHIHS